MASALTPVGASTSLLPMSYHQYQTPHTLPSIKPILTRNLNYNNMQTIRIAIGSDKKFKKLKNKLDFFLKQSDNNFNINILSEDGSSALDVAIDNNQPDLIMWLLEHGINTSVGRPNKVMRVKRMPPPSPLDTGDYRNELADAILQYGNLTYNTLSTFYKSANSSNLKLNSLQDNPNYKPSQKPAWYGLFGWGGKHHKTHHRKRRTLRKKHTKTRRHHRK
jgi:hypothetical protein